ncbi:hypothetical protein GCM10012275_59580 [Longimycelium tulufanense]|uniref:Uncharacterized protein n=1 Tax=Longimycelium tulufanense TaxID=907463 RepID=A0A8J3CKB1_9PSEU|nr:hypothetical protein [Longimycelium tulufanense]GGM81012.1 hypothetical protein GCM10012275_59580 [Longimycelium tulufanense]
MSPPSIPPVPGFRDSIDHPASPSRADCCGPPAAHKRGRAGAVPSVRFCPVDPNAGLEDRLIAAIRVLVAAYTVPGDRVALADAADPTVGGARAAREYRDRLVETVLRLGRGATVEPPRHAAGDHPRDGDAGLLGAGSWSGPGLGPDPEPPPGAVGGPTARAATDRPFGRHPDPLDLIILGCTRHPADPSAVIDWAPRLDPNGTLIVLTHRNHAPHRGPVRSGSLRRIAALANLILTDRLILAPCAPSTTPPTHPRVQRAVALGGHHRLHTTARVFRPVMPSPEARDA